MSPSPKTIFVKAKLEFDLFAQQRRRLKEAEGAHANISALKAVLKKDR